MATKRQRGRQSGRLLRVEAFESRCMLSATLDLGSKIADWIRCQEPPLDTKILKERRLFQPRTMAPSKTAVTAALTSMPPTSPMDFSDS